MKNCHLMASYIHVIHFSHVDTSNSCLSSLPASLLLLNKAPSFLQSPFVCRILSLIGVLWLSMGRRLFPGVRATYQGLYILEENGSPSLEQLLTANSPWKRVWPQDPLRYPWWQTEGPATVQIGTTAVCRTLAWRRMLRPVFLLHVSRSSRSCILSASASLLFF